MGSFDKQRVSVQSLGRGRVHTSVNAARMSACATVLLGMLCVNGQTYDLAWSPDGRTVALAGFKEVRLIDPTNAAMTSLKGAADGVRAVAFSKDGALLAAAGGLPGRG